MSNLKKDPIEDTMEYKKVIAEVDKEVEETLTAQGIDKSRGYVSVAWPLKKKILLEKYNIDWKTPQELNPQIKFD